MKTYTFIFLFLTGLVSVHAQVIDVHMHGYGEDGYWGGEKHPYAQIDSPKTAEVLLTASLMFSIQ